jgi:hypothetical protein
VQRPPTVPASSRPSPSSSRGEAQRRWTVDAADVRRESLAPTLARCPVLHGPCPTQRVCPLVPCPQRMWHRATRWAAAARRCTQVARLEGERPGFSAAFRRVTRVRTKLGGLPSKWLRALAMRCRTARLAVRPAAPPLSSFALPAQGPDGAVQCLPGKRSLTLSCEHGPGLVRHGPSLNLGGERQG